MKKVILGSVLAVVAASSFAAATTTACTGTAGNGTQVASSNASDFIKVNFTPKCSANTYVFGEDNGTYYRVGATSTKGKSAFGGSTNGGGVAATACGSATCGVSDATTAMNSAASS